MSLDGNVGGPRVPRPLGDAERAALDARVAGMRARVDQIDAELRDRPGAGAERSRSRVGRLRALLDEVERGADR